MSVREEKSSESEEGIESGEKRVNCDADAGGGGGAGGGRPRRLTGGGGGGSMSKDGWADRKDATSTGWAQRSLGTSWVGRAGLGSSSKVCQKQVLERNR